MLTLKFALLVVHMLAQDIYFKVKTGYFRRISIIPMYRKTCVWALLCVDRQ